MPVVAAYATVLALFESSVGRWDAYFVTTEKYGVEPTPPWSTAWGRIDGIWAEASEDVHRLVGWQTLWVAVLMLMVIAIALRRGRRLGQALAIVPVVVALWLVTLATGEGVATFRADALLAPAAVVTAHLPRALQVLLLLGAGSIAVLMAGQFFLGALH